MSLRMSQPPIRFPAPALDRRTCSCLLPRRPDSSLKLLIDKLIAARLRAGMTQEYVAYKLRTTKSAVSRLESGKLHRPLLTTLENYALVVGCEVEITLNPVWERARAG
jgi:DNA-binding XRE family transcriptional regulator